MVLHKKIVLLLKTNQKTQKEIAEHLNLEVRHLRKIIAMEEMDSNFITFQKIYINIEKIKI